MIETFASSMHSVLILRHLNEKRKSIKDVGD